MQEKGMGNWEYLKENPQDNSNVRHVSSMRKSNSGKLKQSADDYRNGHMSTYRGWNNAGSMLPDDMSNGLDSERHTSCRIRFQQSPVEVYSRFLATDHDSSRVSYFVNRRTSLRVTDLVLSLLRVSDPRIASLHGRILQGRSMGRTEVQVLSPITGRVIGAKEVRVGNDKVSISQLQVRVVSGLQLSITPDTAVENGYIAETSVTRKLTAQYQEGLLDIDLEFSDGSRTPLRDVAVTDYYLLVESLDPEVVAFAPMVASHHPRVIAVGEGHGDLLHVALLLAEDCRSPSRRTPYSRWSGLKEKVKQVLISSGRLSELTLVLVAPTDQVQDLRRLLVPDAQKSHETYSAIYTPDCVSIQMGGGKGGSGNALASASASVEVDFSASDIPQRPDFVQNDGGGNIGGTHNLRDRKLSRDMPVDNIHPGTCHPKSCEPTRVKRGMEQCQNERAGVTRDPGGGNQINGIVQHDSHLGKSGSNPTGNQTLSTKWLPKVGSVIRVGSTGPNPPKYALASPKDWFCLLRYAANMGCVSLLRRMGSWKRPLGISGVKGICRWRNTWAWSLGESFASIQIKDENNHEPTVQARQHHSIVANGMSAGMGLRHHNSMHMTPLEIGLYVLLAAFCFAIVVFVVSCVVYASKFKPQPIDARRLPLTSSSSGGLQSLGGLSGKVGPSNALDIGSSSGNGKKQLQESTTNAHDWVWLGRATLERSSGHVVVSTAAKARVTPAFTNNNNVVVVPPTDKEAQQMCITANPMSYGIREIDNEQGLGTCFDNPNHIDLPSKPPAVDTATYCKKEKAPSRQHFAAQQSSPSRQLHFKLQNKDLTPEKIWQIAPSPPPLPPHGVPLEKLMTSEAVAGSSDNSEYKPPVPPHRNIGVTARIGPLQQQPGPLPGFLPQQGAAPSRRHHHHHHHHHRSGGGGGHHHRGSRAGNTQDDDLRPEGILPKLEIPAELQRHHSRDDAPPQKIYHKRQSKEDRSSSRGAVRWPVDLCRLLSLVGGGAAVVVGQVLEIPPVAFPIAEIGINNPEPVVTSGWFMGVCVQNFCPIITAGQNEYHIATREHDEDKDCRQNTSFIDFQLGGAAGGSGVPRRGNSPEVKRATIVGNPMFSTAEGVDDEIRLREDDLQGLEDLSLEMNYDQIMEYFDNLKESNA
ncbi:hypothetical protein PR048_026137 [Dryococelus australis]|uniref:Uncharacterized protein n=1 Tax=Dryococelus australis TaxID=614101 RepID=A0ABQ9GKI2_9NEOP|nr:hypothetical protein PR048_026137 [Dryococelus australis]